MNAFKSVSLGKHAVANIHALPPSQVFGLSSPTVPLLVIRQYADTEERGYTEFCVRFPSVKVAAEFFSEGARVFGCTVTNPYEELEAYADSELDDKTFYGEA